MKSDSKTPIGIVNENAEAFTDLNFKLPKFDTNTFISNPNIYKPVNKYVSTGQKDQDDKMLNTLTGQALINAKMLESLNKQTSINDEMLKSLKEQSASNIEMVNTLKEQAAIYKEIHVALVDMNTSNKKESKKNTWELVLMVATLLAAVIVPLVIKLI